MFPADFPRIPSQSFAISILFMLVIIDMANNLKRGVLRSGFMAPEAMHDDVKSVCTIFSGELLAQCFKATCNASMCKQLALAGGSVTSVTVRHGAFE